MQALVYILNGRKKKQEKCITSTKESILLSLNIVRQNIKTLL